MDVTPEEARRIEAAYINEIYDAMKRYSARMTGRVPVPVLTADQEDRARRARAIAQVQDALDEGLGLDASPTVASVERFLRGG